MNTAKIEQAIAEAAFKARQQLWSEFGESHDLDKLKAIYADWFETAIQGLIDDCMPIAAGGTNRDEVYSYSFHKAIANLKPNYTLEDEYDQFQFDQMLAA